MGEFVKAAKKEDISAGHGKAVYVGGRRIAVFNVDGVYYAIHDSCTHQGAPLSGGHVTGKEVTCSWHGARFDVTTGEALSRVAFTPVHWYNIRVANGDLEIEV